jgi:hypothetical protein
MAVIWVWWVIYAWVVIGDPAAPWVVRIGHRRGSLNCQLFRLAPVPLGTFYHSWIYLPQEGFRSCDLIRCCYGKVRVMYVQDGPISDHSVNLYLAESGT